VTQFTAELRGLDQLHERLRPGRLLQPTRRFIEDLSNTAQRTAQRAAKPHAADKGTLGRDISIEISHDGSIARVAPNSRIAGIAFTIEEGRRPGRRPPYGAIKRWAESHGFVPVGRGNSKFIQEIREQIKSRGTQGIHFMRQADEAVQRAMRDGVPRTEAEIHDAWQRN
jgi:hypothetical protein